MDSNYGSVSQWYSTQSSFKLKEDYYKGTLSHKEKAKRKYDLSIKSRFDTFCMIQTEDDINRFVRQMQYLLVSEDVGVYTSWIEIMDGDIRTEFATMIGKDQLMHKMWDNILPEISRWYHLAAENHHDIFTKYVAHQLKYTKMRLVSRNILQKFIIVRPTIKIDKLKRIYKDQNYNKLEDYIIKHYQQFNSIWNGAPFK